MGNDLYIAKKNKPEYFNMGNYFPYIEGISTHKSEAKKLNMTENELCENVLKTQDTEDLKDNEWKEYLKEVAKKLYNWIGNNEIWQETESSFDYIFDIINYDKKNPKTIFYEETMSRYEESEAK